MCAVTPLTHTTSTMEEGWLRTRSKMVCGYSGVSLQNMERLKNSITTLANSHFWLSFKGEGKYFASSLKWEQGRNNSQVTCWKCNYLFSVYIWIFQQQIFKLLTLYCNTVTWTKTNGVDVDVVACPRKEAVGMPAIQKEPWKWQNRLLVGLWT